MALIALIDKTGIPSLALGGQLINNTNIYGHFEGMNVWYKRLDARPIGSSRQHVIGGHRDTAAHWAVANPVRKLWTQSPSTSVL